MKDMLDRCEFDTIYHEHLCYFSLTALDALVRRHGLALVDVERLPIHGGSLRLASATTVATSRRPVAQLLAEEQRLGRRGRRRPTVLSPRGCAALERELLGAARDAARERQRHRRRTARRPRGPRS